MTPAGRASQASLPNPPSPALLADFPRFVLGADVPLWRLHRSDRAPNWFTNSGLGRFDVSDADFGTCYVAGGHLADREVDVLGVRVRLPVRHDLARNGAGDQVGNGRLRRLVGAVRIHDDRAADTIGRRLQACAFTTGAGVYFSAGQYRPAMAAGQALLPHELAHVGQQRESRPGSRIQRKASGATDPVAAALDYEGTQQCRDDLGVAEFAASGTWFRLSPMSWSTIARSSATSWSSGSTAESSSVRCRSTVVSASETPVREPYRWVVLPNRDPTPHRTGVAHPVAKPSSGSSPWRIANKLASARFETPILA